MDQVSAASIAKALDALHLRYQFIAQNLANAADPAYRPVRVDFEEALKEAASKGVDEVRRLEPGVTTARGSALANGVRIDLEIAAASQTSSRYSTLADLLTRRMTLEHAVLSEGGAR